MFQSRSSSRAAALLMTGALLAGMPARAQSPSESVVLVHVDVAGLMQSELGKQLMAKYDEKMDKSDPEYLNFKAATGIDPEKDIRAITVGVAGDLSGDAKQFYAIIDGNFDAAKIESFAKTSGKTTLGQKAGLTTITPNEVKPGDPKPLFSVLDSKTMLIATETEFDALAASAKTGTVPTVPAINKVFKKGDKGQFHIVMALPAATKEQMKANPQSAAFANVETIVFSADVGTDVDVYLKTAADSEANGKPVYDAMNGFLAIGKMMSAEQPVLQNMLAGLKLEQAGALTTISMSVKSADLLGLLAQADGGDSGATHPASSDDADSEGEAVDEEEEADAAATPAP